MTNLLKYYKHLENKIFNLYWFIYTYIFFNKFTKEALSHLQPLMSHFWLFSTCGYTNCNNVLATLSTGEIGICNVVSS